MKRNILLAVLAVIILAGCRQSSEPKVMARAVPERADDFVFENNLIAGRFYGKALEGNPTSPGLDIWVKLPGKLVANEWYKGYLEESDAYYHHDHGGKDCYKVAVSLGGGASVPFVGGKLRWPATNYRSCKVLESTPDKVVFILEYPAWDVDEYGAVSLKKKVTVCSDSYFIDVEDTYSFSGEEKMPVAVGFKLHGEQETVQDRLEAADRLAIWEKASDQSIEPEDGLIGVAVVMPGAESAFYSPEFDHGLLTKEVLPGGTVSYKVGSCWSKGDIKTSSDWFDLDRKLK